ncbi:hypothetical protein EZI54_02495 [Marinobacter halodurans]|uniref:Uncharacterized protein n=1 Tax=Marinobacter halodurans TaxID=2528979 RepID=A0ABY1ZRF1_9GAMM|nr:hypothetical protein [Marinobacter halodurans]TBW58758.1 hypothetical protein EZI54_02495 [Marinobacter halodurans]
MCRCARHPDLCPAASRRGPCPWTLAVLALATLILTACAQFPRRPAPLPEALDECMSLFVQADQVIDQADARDHGPARIYGFPYLRVNRFLASFRETAASAAQQRDWIERMASLDAEARALELQNAGQPVAGLTGRPLHNRLDDCRSRLVNHLLGDPVRVDRLRQAAVVPDDYVTSWRVLGLYPIASAFVSDRIRRGHQEMEDIFATPLDQLPVAGRLIRWRETPPAPIPGPVRQHDPAFRYDALGIPQLSAQTVQQLFRRHAPTWEIDVVDDNDLIGTPVWQYSAAIDTEHPTEYRRLSYTRFGSRVLLQLNYVIWFKARPGQDIYAGRIDGLTWRVTLGPDGQPWLYDSIHNCGCYHTFFPVAPLRLRPDLSEESGEPPLVPQQAPSGPLVVRLDHGRHFINRVYSDAGHRTYRPLAVAAYDRLRSLPTANGHHSFFGPYGLVPGSERPERFILWPMGVRSAGAMRQWGHHAVAFIGRRHFDDPRLVQSLFERESP